MAVALVRHHVAGSAASGATVSATVTVADVSIGSVLVAWVSFDNLTTTTPTVSSLSKPGAETASWARVALHDAVTAAAGSAVRGELWVIKTTVAWTVATAVTATLSAAYGVKTILLSEFSGALTAVRGTAGSGTATNGQPSASTSGTAPVAGDLVLGAATFELDTTVTADTDTTNGSWATAYSKVVGTGITAVTGVLQYKIVTGTGVQTYNPTSGSTECGAAVVALATGNNAPNAPTLNVPANNEILNRAVTNRFGFTPSDPDAGDSQSKFDLQYKLVGAGSWTTITQTTPNSYWDAVGSTFALGDYEWQDRTYDSQGLVGPWSVSGFFTAADAPSVPTITEPTNGATVLNTENLTWSTPDQTNYQYRRVADLAGAPDPTTVYYDSGEITDAVTRSLTVAYPVNNRYEHTQVRIKFNGLWSTWASVRNPVSWTAPMVPTLTATPDPAWARINVAITNPAPTGGEPAVSYNDVYVSSPLDVEERLATLVPPNSTWVWRTPAAARVYTIRVESVGSNGTRASSV